MNVRPPYIAKLLERAALATLWIAGGAQSAHAQSFNCKRAHSTMERLVCADADLRRQDVLMARAFALALRGPGGDRQRMAQRQWLEQARACSDTACLQTAYFQRFEQLLTSDGKAAPKRVYRPQPRPGLDYRLTVVGPARGIAEISFDGIEYGPHAEVTGDIRTGSYSGIVAATGGSFSPGKRCRVQAIPQGPGAWRLTQHGDSVFCGMGAITPSTGLYREAH